MAFDPRRTDLDELDTTPAKDAPLGGFNTTLRELHVQAEFLTTQLKAQIQERIAGLESREKTLMRKTRSMVDTIESGLATLEQETRYYLDSHELKVIRLDLLDSHNALAMIEMEDPAKMSLIYEEPRFKVDIDKWVAH